MSYTQNILNLHNFREKQLTNENSVYGLHEKKVNFSFRRTMREMTLTEILPYRTCTVYFTFIFYKLLYSFSYYYGKHKEG